jgi:hypothetical protein
MSMQHQQQGRGRGRKIKKSLELEGSWNESVREEEDERLVKFNRWHAFALMHGEEENPSWKRKDLLTCQNQNTRESENLNEFSLLLAKLEGGKLGRGA